MRAKLDHAYCLTAECQPGRRKTDHWCTHIPGFVLEVRSGGGKTYALRYVDAGGRQRQHKIGSYGVISNADARKAATRLRAEVELGGNPQAAKEEKKAVPLYSELAEQHRDHAKLHQRRPSNTEAVLDNHLIPRWGRMLITDITSQDIGKWFAEKRQGGLAPATVEKIRSVFSRSFELARMWSIPGAVINPVRNVQRVKFNNARERYLSAKEAERLFRELDKSENKQLKAIVQLLLLTGARKTELFTAKWDQVDLERRTWHIPTTKTGVPRYVPLSKAAVAIIEKLPRWEKCDYLVPNPRSRKPFVSVKRAWETAREAAGLSGLRIHDLRHSAASLMINAGIDLYAVGKVLGHADHKSTERYSHLSNDTLMRAVEAGAAKLNAASGSAAHGI